jgi:hypothetical protein
MGNLLTILWLIVVNQLLLIPQNMGRHSLTPQHLVMRTGKTV